MSALMDIEEPLNTLEAVTLIVRHFIASESPIRDRELAHIQLQLKQSHDEIKELWEEALAERIEERKEYAAALAEARAKTAAALAAAAPLSGAELSNLLELRVLLRAAATLVMNKTGPEETGA